MNNLTKSGYYISYSSSYRQSVSPVFDHLQQIIITILKHQEKPSFPIRVNNLKIYLLNASFSWITFECLIILRTLTSLRVVFRTCSSSSVSLNFLMATSEVKEGKLTVFACFFVSGLVDYAISAFVHNSFDFVLIHFLIYFKLLLTRFEFN